MLPVAPSHTATRAHLLRTETVPPLYYMPKRHNDATRARLREQQRATIGPLDEELKVMAADGRRRPRMAADGRRWPPMAADDC